MKNVVFLVLAVLFFAAAYYVYWLVAQENAPVPATRSIAPGGTGDGGAGVMSFIHKWQPYLSALSSVGGILSFVIQVRVWMRSKQN